ncbi:hypothetical protein K7X08_005857 [Anisodus acutangulus]|uniref:Mitochondrial substrate carrier family protein ucpB n=1 Tax=Anisodus acutangulus TaxID=402998 RepID=A0A9Q1R7A9_9SOLA|nr:hypothetical protein K7X08_005857 [Anisodus acutangulus]
MTGDSTPATGKILSSGSTEVKERRKWGVSASDVVSHFGTSGMSVAAATGITHPLDVLKVRLQMQLVGQRGPLVGMGRLSLQVVESEGLRSLYLGLVPALTRSVLYGGLRLGLYEPSKYLCELTFESTNILVKIASGAFSGAVATALTNPMEILKVRLQMNTRSSVGPIHEMRRIASEEGVRALWKGVGPAMARAATLTASQLATYDESKQAIIKYTPLEEGFHLHLISSTIAGTVSTLMTAPMDMVKTRLMLQRESSCAGMYRNGLHCAYQVLRSEGPSGLYKGGLAIFARLAPQTMITFVLCEKLRGLAGLKAI